MECEIEQSEEIYKICPDYCENCFVDESILHYHNLFLKIDDIGNHFAVKRLIGLSEPK